MATHPRAGWMFGESAVQVKKTFEKFVVRVVIAGLVINAAVVMLLYAGILQRPGKRDAQQTQPVPAPDDLATRHTLSPESTITQSGGVH